MPEPGDAHDDAGRGATPLGDAGREAARDETAQDEVRRGFDVAYRSLAQKERTETEMREFLAKRDIGPAAIEIVVEELSQTGGVDDAEFARRFAEDKRRLAGWGSARIRETLSARGVDRQQIEAALAEGEGAGEIERALELIAGRGYDLTLERDRARALGVLARRGYESEVAYDAVRRLEAGDWEGR